MSMIKDAKTLERYLKMIMVNNYRKLHGKHTHRWVHLRKERVKSYKRCNEE